MGENNEFALRLIEIQYNTMRSEIEYYLGKMYDVLRLSLATVPIIAGALIALVADQSTWTLATGSPILLGLFCLLSPMFLVICVYLGNIGISQYKAVSRAADYVKVYFEDYLFQPIIEQLDTNKENSVLQNARFTDFLFWENYLSQHGVPDGDTKIRSDYDADKHVMFSFLIFLSTALVIISAICLVAFFALIWNTKLFQSAAQISLSEVLFEVMILFSATLFTLAMIWTVRSFYKFFGVINKTGVLSSSIDGGLK